MLVLTAAAGENGQGVKMSNLELDSSSLRNRARQCRDLANSLLTIATAYDAMAAQAEGATIHTDVGRRSARTRPTRTRSVRGTKQ